MNQNICFANQIICLDTFVMQYTFLKSNKMMHNSFGKIKQHKTNKQNINYLHFEYWVNNHFKNLHMIHMSFCIQL